VFRFSLQVLLKRFVSTHALNFQVKRIAAFQFARTMADPFMIRRTTNAPNNIIVVRFMVFSSSRSQ